MGVPTPKRLAIAFLEAHRVRLLPVQQLCDVHQIAPDRLIPDQCLMKTRSPPVRDIQTDDAKCVGRIPPSWLSGRRVLYCLNVEVSNRRPIRHPGKSHCRKEHQAGQKNGNQCQLSQSLLHVTVFDDAALY